MGMRRSWIPALVVLGVVAGRAWAQSGEAVFIPSEADINVSCNPPSTGPFGTILGHLFAGIVVGAPILPFVIGASHLARRKYGDARWWASVVLAIGGIQAVVVMASTWDRIRGPSWSAGDLMGVILPVGWTGVVLLAALWLSWTARRHAENPPRIEAGRRVRGPGVVDDGPGPARVEETAAERFVPRG